MTTRPRRPQKPHTERTGNRRIGSRIGKAALAVAVLATLAAPTAPAQAKEAKRGAGASMRTASIVPAQETQAQRDARVARLSISPGDLEVQCGSSVLFTALAEDSAGAPVGGVLFTWSARDADSGEEMPISAVGEFAPPRPGRYRVEVAAAGQRAEATVNAVVPMEEAVTTAAIAPAAFTDEPTWNAETVASLADPGNQRGSNPLEKLVPGKVGLADRHATETGAGSGNFHLAIPILGLDGRGLDLGLTLHYNAAVWQRFKGSSQDQMVFAPRVDDDWPAPGWSLGFGKVAGRVLVDDDGTRHVLGGEYPNLHTTDGTFIDCSFDPDPLSTDVRCRYPNGLVIDFNHFTLRGYRYPTKITDANGNYILITYRDLSTQSTLPPGRRVGPPIETITDTLGRTVRFRYEAEVENPEDYSGILTSITTPGLDGTERTLVRFNWSRRPLTPAFSVPLWPRTPPDIRVLKAVWFPGTASGYWFGAADSYSAYGMLAAVREQRDMVFSGASLTEQGVIEQGRTTRELLYNFPFGPDETLTRAPAYTQLTEWWEGMATNPAVTSFAVTRGLLDPSNEPWQEVETTFPDGTRHVQLHESLKPVRDELYDASGKLMRETETTWEEGDYSSPRPKRIETAGEHDAVSVDVFEYGAQHNQVKKRLEIEKRSSDGQETVLRRTETEYANEPQYLQRHIFNLPKAIDVFEGSNASRASSTQLAYDGGTLAKTPGVVHHDPAFDPDSPPVWVPPPCKLVCTRPCGPLEECEPICEWVCQGEGHWQPQYDPLTAYRGNVTRVTRYAKAADLAEPVVETRAYNLVGSVVSVTTGCCQRTSVLYTQDTQYAYPTEETTGAPDAASPVRVKTSATYDFNTGVARSVTDANGRTTLMASSPATLRPEQVLHPTGAATKFAYDDVTPRITVSSAAATPGEAPGSEVTTWFNGRGLAWREARAAEGGWDVMETRYDERGRSVERSQPVRRSGDAGTWAAPEFWNNLSYDALSRVTATEAPDGSADGTFYDEPVRPAGASNAPGETVRSIDPWGRWRWARVDGLGRLAEVLEPNPDGDGSLAGAGNLSTTYLYDGLGLVEISQGEQRRRLLHDSVGRLRSQSLPEKLPTLDDAGGYVGAGGRWTDVFRYDDRSNLISHTDARGIETVYAYGDDPLGRLRTVTYDTSGFGDVEHPVLPAPRVSFTYLTTGDIRRVDQVSIDGVGAQTLTYDAEGRLNSTKMELESWAGHPLVVDYVIDSLDRLTDLRYPAEHGVGAAQRRTLHHDYELGALPEGIKLDGTQLASGITFNPFGMPSSVKVGSGTLQASESFGFDPATGRLTSQTVERGGTTLLDLAYEYVRAGESGQSGQLTALVDNLDTAKSQSYQYDLLGRLAEAAGGDPSAPSWTQNYAIDRYGNRTGVVAAGTYAGGKPIPSDGRPHTEYSSSTNRITTAGFKYDAAGNLTRGERDGVWQQYRYDAAGRLAKVLDDSGAVIESYVYGVGRERLMTERAKDPVARTYYAWGGNRVLSEYDQAVAPPGQDKDKDKKDKDKKDKDKKDKDGTAPAPLPPGWARSRVYLGDRLLATLERTIGTGPSAVVRYHHPNHLGGTRLVSGAASADVGEQLTLPFGTALTAHSTVDVNPRFTSYDRSPATGLDYAVNRYYDSHTGRFSTVDPIGMAAIRPDDPQSLNLFAYVRNNLVNAVDRLGLKVDGEVTYICIEGEGCRSYLSQTLVVEGNPSSGPAAGWGAGPFGIQLGGGSSGGGDPAGVGAASRAAVAPTIPLTDWLTALGGAVLGIINAVRFATTGVEVLGIQGLILGDVPVTAISAAGSAQVGAAAGVNASATALLGLAAAASAGLAIGTLIDYGYRSLWGSSIGSDLYDALHGDK